MSERLRPRSLAWLGALFLALSISTRGFALEPSTDILQFNCRTWSRQTGLPVNGINAIAQTMDGYLWLGTSAGLVRFDGNDFRLTDLGRVSELRNSIVTSLASAREGGLWVGLENSAFGLYDGQSLSFRGKDEWGGVDMNTRTILENTDGTLWLAAQRQASRLTKAGGYEEVLGTSEDTVINILCGYEDSHGRVWFGTDKDGLYYWQAGEITRMPETALDATQVFSIAEDLEGRIWFGTSLGLFCRSPDLQPMEIPPLPDEIRSVIVDRHGVLWIGTTGRGLARYRNGTYTFLRKTDGLASDFVKAIAEDREGNLWIGTRDGVSQLTDVKFPTFRAAEDPSVKDACAVTASRRGGVWIGSSHGLSYFNGKIKTYSSESGIPKPLVKRVFEASNGDVYLVNGHRDLVIFSGEKAVATYAASNMVVGMTEDAKGVVVSVGGELYRAGRDYFTPYVFASNQPPPLAWVLNLAPSRDGSFWAATVNGIFRVKDDGTYQQWSAAQGLSSAVQWICEDSDGVVWAATLTGIARLKDDQIRCINRRNGLFDDNIFAIVPDDFGNLWVDSGRGIFQVTRRDMNDFADGRTDRVQCVVYDGPESVKTTDKTIQEHVACKTSDGRIWFPSPNGVVTIDPAHILINQLPPPVHIDSVLGNGRTLARTATINVPPGKGELEFHFTALSFIAPQKILFRYRLVGYDKDWVEAGDRRMAFYTNLKPGRYTFHVIAANADGIWNKTGDSLGIELLPHYYQTAWFYVLCSGLACAVLAGIYAWRVRHLNQKQRALQKSRDLLETEVQHRTAELANANASLLHEVEGHKRTANQLEQRTLSLEDEIEERKRMEREIEKTHRQLLEISHRAGQAEVATNVLHNVGNVLNSVNTSAGVIAENLRTSKLPGMSRVLHLLEKNRGDLPGFFASVERAEQFQNYLKTLNQLLNGERLAALGELECLTRNIDHIKDIVTMQQSYSKVSGVTESILPADLLEDSVRMNASSLARHDIEVVREFQDVPPITLEKHKALQILVNLIRNAKQACDEAERTDKRVTLRIANGDGRVRISVSDNGTGISPENLTRIFNHGFTTRRDGHGFGLHSGALAAREMGGALRVHSEGLGKGSTFTLELPVKQKEQDS